MTAADGVAQRLGRLRPRHVPSAIRGWIVICWVMSLGLVAVLLVPGVTDGVSATGEGAIGRFSAPLAFRVALLVALAVLAGASVVWVLLRDRVHRTPHRLDTLVRELIIIPIAVFPAVALLADHALLPAGVAAVVGLAFLVLVHLPLARSGLGAASALGLVAALPWLVLCAYQATPAGSSSQSWVWVTLFGAAAAFAAFGSYYGVARAAESRAARLGFLSRSALHPGIVIAIVVACVVVVILRLTVARDLFPSPDPELWSPFGRSPLSWLIAGAVAGLLVVVSVRASTQPLTRFGERRVVAGLAGLGNLELIGQVLVIVLGMLVAIAISVVFLPTGWLALIPAAKLAGVVLLAVLVLTPPFRGSAARWVGLISALFLAALTLNTTLITAGVALPPVLDAFPATPVQVLLVMLAAATALAFWNLISPSRRVSSGLVARIAVVPLIAVHAGWLLPAAWSGLGRLVVVVGVLVALFWLMPPVAADRTRHGFHVLSASLAQLLVLVVFVLAIPSLFADGALTVLGLLWLSIPIIAALTIDAGANRVQSSPEQTP